MTILRSLRFPSGIVGFQYLDINSNRWYSTADVHRIASNAAIAAAPIFDVHCDGVSSSLDPVAIVAMMSPLIAHKDVVLEPVLRGLKRNDPVEVLELLDESSEWATYGVSYSRNADTIILKVVR